MQNEGALSVVEGQVDAASGIEQKLAAILQREGAPLGQSGVEIATILWQQPVALQPPAADTQSGQPQCSAQPLTTVLPGRAQHLA